ncbi:MAG: hypothetical protein WCS65_02610 [Verrucomicrobiae bacterium]
MQETSKSEDRPGPAGRLGTLLAAAGKARAGVARRWATIQQRWEQSPPDQGWKKVAGAVRAGISRGWEAIAPKLEAGRSAKDALVQRLKEDFRQPAELPRPNAPGRGTLAMQVQGSLRSAQARTESGEIGSAVILGGTGDLGCALAEALRRAGTREIVLVDDIFHEERWKNLAAIPLENLFSWDAIFTELRRRSLRWLADITHIFLVDLAGAAGEHEKVSRGILLPRLLRNGCPSAKFLHFSQGNRAGLDSEVDRVVLRMDNTLSLQTGFAFGARSGPSCLIRSAWSQIHETGQVVLPSCFRPGGPQADSRLDFVCSADIARAAIQLAGLPEAEGSYGLAPAGGLTCLSAVEELFSAMGKQPRISYAGDCGLSACEVDCASFEALLPDFRFTPFPEAVREAIAAWDPAAPALESETKSPSGKLPSSRRRFPSTPSTR